MEHKETAAEREALNLLQLIQKNRNSGENARSSRPTSALIIRPVQYADRPKSRQLTSAYTYQGIVEQKLAKLAAQEHKLIQLSKNKEKVLGVKTMLKARPDTARAIHVVHRLQSAYNAHKPSDPALTDVVKTAIACQQEVFVPLQVGKILDNTKQSAKPKPLSSSPAKKEPDSEEAKYIQLGVQIDREESAPSYATSARQNGGIVAKPCFLNSRPQTASADPVRTMTIGRVQSAAIKNKAEIQQTKTNIQNNREMSAKQNAEMKKRGQDEIKQKQAIQEERQEEKAMKTQAQVRQAAVSKEQLRTRRAIERNTLGVLKQALKADM